MPQGTVSASLISSVNNLHQREIFNQLVDVTNEKASLLEMLARLNRMEETKSTTYHNFTNRMLYEAEAVTAFTDPSTNGTEVTLTLTGANGQSQGVVGKIVVFPDGRQGRVQSRVNDAGGDVITVAALNPAEPLSSPVGAEVTFMTNAQPEASLIPEAEYRLMDKEQNQTQIYRNYGEITDVQDVSAIEIELGGQPYIFYKIQHDTLLKHEADISHSLFIQRQSDPNFTSQAPTLVDPDTGRPIQTTRGLNQEIELNGINIAGATINNAFWDNLAREFAAIRAPKEYTIYGGIEPSIQWTNFFNALGSANRVSDSARFSVDGRALDFGIDTVKYHDYKFGFKHMACLDHTGTLGNVSSNVRRRMFFVPEGQVETEYGKGAVDRMRIRYFALKGGDSNSGLYRETMFGKLSPNKGSGKQVLGVDVDSHLGLEVLGANFFAQATLA